MAKYRKLPVEIEAVQLQFTTTSQQECIEFTNNTAKKGLDGGVIIPTLEGNMVANTGDFIIKGVNGEFYPCKPDIFHKTYEMVSVVEETEELCLQKCESCEKDFDIETMTTDAGSNYFCKECWSVLGPVLQEEYEEMKSNGEISED